MMGYCTVRDNVTAAQQIKLAQDLGGMTYDPLAAVRYLFPWGKGPLEGWDGPHVWQADIHDTIGKHLRSRFRHEPLKIAVSSGRGIGKSALIAQVSKWAMSTAPDTRVLITANTEDQLATKTWPEVMKWWQMSLDAHLWTPTATRIVANLPKHENTWRLDRVTWSENNVDAFRGLHNLGKRMVVIFDEASGIDDKIWEATEGSLTDEGTEMLWLCFSNPSLPSGRFYECFNRLKHRWVTRNIDSRDVPGTNKAEIARWVEDFGEDSDYVRVNVKGRFPRSGSRQFIGYDVVAGAQKRECRGTGYKVLAVDVARFGSNQTVILERQGLKVTVLEKLRGADTSETARRVMYHIMGRDARCCIVDGDGIGGGVVDQIRAEMPRMGVYPNTVLAEWCKKHPWFQLQEFHGAATPADAFMYANKRAEAWGKMRDWLKEGDIPADAEFEQELTSPEYHLTNKNQIQLERKEDMEKRGVQSPDIADALAMSFDAFPMGETRDEKIVRVQAGITDPMALHFAKLAETQKRVKAKQGGNYWD
jgi:hypothetical protein